MYHPRLYGSFYDMGFKYGNLLHEKVNFKIPSISKKKKTFGLESYQVLKNEYPEAVEEIEGFSQGIKDRPENLAAFLLSLGIFESSGQCSVFAFRNPQSVVVGRNYDMLFAFKKFTESSLIAPSDKYSYISQSDVFIGRSDGINEKGLFVAMSFVNGTQVIPGVSFHFVVKKVLENAASVKEAISLIQETTVSSANNFIIADRSGDIAVVESAPQSSFVRRPSKEKCYLHITNQFVSSKMLEFDRGGVEWSQSLERSDRLSTLLSEKKSVSLQAAKKILSDACVCLDLKKEKFGTIWSVVADLNKISIERAESKPTLARFKKETRLDWWIKKRASSCKRLK